MAVVVGPAPEFEVQLPDQLFRLARPVPALINSRTSSKQRFTATLEGLINILPAYLRTLNLRKSKPLRCA